MSAVRIEKVSVHFNGRKAVDDVSLKLSAGALIGLIGPNGAGKTTLLRAIANLVPFTGAVYLNDENIAAIDRRSLARRLAYMPQGHEVYWPLTAARVVALGRLPYLPAFRRPSRQDSHIIRDVMISTDTHTFAERNVLTLSGGERARVMLARALAVGADFLMVDEPVAALDPYHQLQIMTLLRDLAEKGATIIVVTHDHAVARQTDRVIVLQDGQISDDHRVGHPYEEDLKTFRNSGLGKALLSGDPDAEGWLKNQGLDVLQGAL